MKCFSVILILLFSFCTEAQKDRSKKNFDKAKKEFNLVTSKEFYSLNCSETINHTKMLQFFKMYPQFQEDVKIVSVKNCYGAPDEKFFALLYDDNKKFFQ